MSLPFDFAFEGFRLLRARPWLIAYWGLICLVGYGLCNLILLATVGPFIPAIAAYSSHPDPALLTETMAFQFVLGLAMAVPVYLVTSAVITAAVCRASLERSDDRLGYLRFGVRELQILVVLAATLALQVVVFFAFLTVFSLLPLPPTAVEVLVVVALLVVCWMRVRLSFNVVQTFSSRRIDIFGSVAMTRDRFWPLTGGYLMAFGLAAIVQYLSDQVIGAATAIVSGRMPSANMPDMSSLSAFLTPEHVTTLVLVSSLVAPQVSAIISGAPVAAWRALTPAGTKVAIEV